MTFRVAIAQINPRLGDLQSNLALYEEKIPPGSQGKGRSFTFSGAESHGLFSARYGPQRRVETLRSRDQGVKKAQSRGQLRCRAGGGEFGLPLLQCGNLF